MSLLKSVLFASEGSYNIFGIKVDFQNDRPSHLTFPGLDRGLDGAGVVSQLAYKCLSFNFFHWITQLHTHVFVHEMGHALSIKVLTGYNSEVKIFYKRGGGTIFPEMCYPPDWKVTIIAAAGPMADVAFSTCKLVAATALKSYLSWPVAGVLGSGAVICIFGELLYAYVSASKDNHGDFGIIARNGNTHLALATTTLVSQVALGIFLAIRFAA